MTLSSYALSCRRLSTSSGEGPSIDSHKERSSAIHFESIESPSWRAAKRQSAAKCVT